MVVAISRGHLHLLTYCSERRDVQHQGSGVCLLQRVLQKFASEIRAPTCINLQDDLSGRRTVQATLTTARGFIQVLKMGTLTRHTNIWTLSEDAEHCFVVCARTLSPSEYACILSLSTPVCAARAADTVAL